MTSPAPEGLGDAWLLVDDLDRTRSGAEHMRVDLELLDRAARVGHSALRLYVWAPPALSIGRFQAESDVDGDACARAGIEIVRRPTGGAALLHGGDVTYAVAMPRLPGRDGEVDAVYGLIARGLICGLARLGVEAAIARHDGPAGPVCFATQQGADLRVGARKICGSAQVRRAGGVLQHGSVLLRRLPFDETDVVVNDQDRDALRRSTVTLEELGAPSEPRIVADALIAGFAEAFDIAYATTPIAVETVGGHCRTARASVPS